MGLTCDGSVKVKGVMFARDLSTQKNECRWMEERGEKRGTECRTACSERKSMARRKREGGKGFSVSYTREASVALLDSVKMANHEGTLARSCAKKRGGEADHAGGEKRSRTWVGKRGQLGRKRQSTKRHVEGGLPMRRSGGEKSSAETKDSTTGKKLIEGEPSTASKEIVLEWEIGGKTVARNLGSTINDLEKRKII